MLKMYNHGAGKMMDTRGPGAAGTAVQDFGCTGLALAPKPSTDRALITKLLAGDEAVFAGLVRQYHGRLTRLARVFLSDRSAAEEVVQETWLGVITGLAKFEGRSALKTWIFRILVNRAKTRGTREGRSVPFSAVSNPEADADHEPALAPDRFLPNGMWAAPPRRWERDTPEKLIMHQQALKHLASALAELPANQRAVVTLRDVEGLGSSEVCSALEISENHQRVLLHRGRSKLRRILEEHLE